MKIERLDIRHLSLLVPLFDSYRQFYRKSTDLPGAHSYLYDRLSMKQATVFGAFEENELIGFCLLYPMFSSTRMKAFYLLNDLYVIPHYRNMAAGKSLLNICKKHAMDQHQAGLLLETEKTNDIGNHLYPASGFELIDDSNFYFWENQSA